MQQDSGIALRQLRTDGGMVVNDLLMQIQADALNCSVVRPKMRETTALGAAYAAGLGCGFYRDTESLTREWSVDRTWEPKMEPERRDRQYRQWKKAVARSFDWEES
jgi:glycerol kinase